MKYIQDVLWIVAVLIAAGFITLLIDCVFGR